MIVYPYKERNMSGWYYFDNALSTKDIDLLEKSAKPNLVSAKTEAGNKKEIRKSSIAWLAHDDYTWLYPKLRDLVKEANDTLWDFDITMMREEAQYTEYNEGGGHYGWHMDAGSGILSQRKVSVTVQLSDPEEYEGGELELWYGGDEPIQAPKGKGVGVIFPSYMLHRVTPVTKGTRKSLVLWVGGQHYR